MTEQDLKQIAARGITEQQVEHQLEQFKTGFPFLKLEAAASIGNGIIAPNDEEKKNYPLERDVLACNYIESLVHQQPSCVFVRH